ncbi:hypothetical protein F2Q69_00017690 [Brassica cretica]|uniref:Uncharacterized protein n=1 Tax=Brassica cretica TaxID=69181 RepID=A0A8S9R7P9_BRACR|nr:hypothetical protein F2Q69_00017690 [Brassica cretica]
MGGNDIDTAVTKTANRVPIGFGIDKEWTAKDIDRESMEKMERSSFGGGRETKVITEENPTEERDTLSCGRIRECHVGVLTKPKNPNLNTGPLL